MGSPRPRPTYFVSESRVSSSPTKPVFAVTGGSGAVDPDYQLEPVHLVHSGPSDAQHRRERLYTSGFDCACTLVIDDNDAF